MDKSNAPEKSEMEEHRSLQDYPPDYYTIEGQDPQNAISYKNMMLRETRWAKTDLGWRSVVAVAMIVFLCIGMYMLLIVLNRGWDGLLALLGY